MIRIRPDPDPKHWFKALKKLHFFQKKNFYGQRRALKILIHPFVSVFYLPPPLTAVGLRHRIAFVL